MPHTGHLGSVTQPDAVQRSCTGVSHRRTKDSSSQCCVRSRDLQGASRRCLELPASRGVTTDGLVATGAEDGIRAAVVLGHPHPQFGGTMHTKGVYHSAKALSRIGCAVLRFNFRGVGKSEGSWDDGVGERDDFRAGLDVMAARFPGAPLWAGGMSFGSWVGLNVGVEDPRVSALLGVATPVNKCDFEAVATEHEAEVLHPRRAWTRSAVPRNQRVLRAVRPTRRNW